MNGFSDRGSTPLSSIIKKPKECSDFKGFREFRKYEIGRFRPKKTSLNHIKCGKKISNVKLFCWTKEAIESLSSPLPKVLGEWALQAVLI